MQSAYHSNACTKFGDDQSIQSQFKSNTRIPNYDQKTERVKKNEMKSTFVKKIGAERTLLMLPLNIVMMGRVNGRVDPDQVSNALERLRERHKQLAVRVRFDEQGTGWYDGRNVPKIPVSVEPRIGNNTWLARAQAEYRTPFPIEQGPLVRCALVLADERCDVMLIGHHAICDGMSLAFLLRDLLQAIARPNDPIEVLPSPPPIDDTTVPSPLRSNPIVRWIMTIMNKKWAATNIRFDGIDMKQMHDIFWKNNRNVGSAAYEFDKAATQDLVTRCRVEQVTVNSALWTAYLMAQAQLQKDNKAYRRQAGLAVSTRDKLNVNVGEALGFYASSLSVKLPMPSSKSFWEDARRVHRTISISLAKTDPFRMLAANSVDPTLLDALYFQKYGLINHPFPKKLLRKMSWHNVSYGYAITNVGRVKIPTEYGALKLESVYGPSFYSDVDEKVVGAITVGEKLTLTLNCNEDIIGDGNASGLLDTAVEILKDATKKAD